MTLRTTSATRLTVVSRSSDVAKTSATSSKSDSTGRRSGLETTEPIAGYDNSYIPLFPIAQKGRGCCGSPRRVVTKLLSRHNANVGKVAIFLCVVEPIADHKFIGNLEADIVAFQGKLAPRGLVEQSCNLQRARLVRHEQLFQHREREPGVENVFDHNHIFIF